MYAVGSTAVLDYATSGSATGTMRMNTTVTRQTTFNGFAALEQVTDLTITLTAPSAGSTATNSKGYSTGLTATGITQYGALATTDLSSTLPGASSSSTTTYNPPWVDKTALLAVGESYTTTVTGTTITQTVLPGVPTSPQTSTTSTTHTVRFVGFESVTVPAGTYANACRFEITTATGTSTDTSTSWVSSGGSGVSVKQVGGSGSSLLTQVLTAGTVNGAAVR